MELKFRITAASPLKLPLEFKTPWLEKLRSGEFKQAKEFLHVGDGYCCLGVGCEVAGAEWETSGVNNGLVVHCTEAGSRVMPMRDDFPEAVYAALVQATDAPQVHTDMEFDNHNELDECAVMDALAAFNDAGASFADIADWIEVNL